MLSALVTTNGCHGKLKLWLPWFSIINIVAMGYHFTALLSALVMMVAMVTAKAVSYVTITAAAYMV